MEKIEFNYIYRDKNGEEKTITVSHSNENGVYDYDICETFFDFIKSVGFSEENVFKYFNK